LLQTVGMSGKHNEKRSNSLLAFVRKEMAEPRMAKSAREEITNRKFKLNDMVRISHLGPELFKILVFRHVEPCCQIEISRDGSKQLEWMGTDELELANG
jgi:hypothetical protein